MDYKQTLEYLDTFHGSSMSQSKRDELDIIRTKALVIIAQAFEDIEDIIGVLGQGIADVQEAMMKKKETT